MFDLPGAKRVRRDELLSRNSSSRSPSPSAESAIPDAQKRLSALLNFDIAPSTTTAATEPQDLRNDNEDEEQEFEFRLFSAPAPAPRLPGSDDKDAQKPGDITTDGTDGAQKLRIRLRSPTPTAAGSGEGRFVNPFRGWDYYFSTPGLLSGETNTVDEDAGVLLKKKQFEDVAVSGEEMEKLSGVSWPGCHLPWRVIHLKREHTKLPKDEKGTVSVATVCVVDPPEREPLSRKKPGKKRRIQLRKRAVVADRTKESEAEKRNRKNREKKLKRRQKAREQKAAAAAAGGVPITDLGGDVSGQESD